ncbi:MAG: hypothetical protein AAFO07_04275 [Bacteroidota bacterium]
MTIKEWLDKSGSFRQGLDLLREHGTAADLRIFRPYEKAAFILPDVKDRLIECLKKYVPTEESVEAIRRPIIPQQPKEEPEQVTNLRARGRALKKEESYYHALLVQAAQEEDTAERKKKLAGLAETILEIEFELDEVYGDIRAYENKGIIPITDKQKIIDETVDKMKKRNSLKSRISKIKTLLKEKLPESEKSALTLESEQKQKQLTVLEEELRL